MTEYRVIECYGRYFNRRWELQEKYHYWENGNRIESWYMVCCGTKEFCEGVLQRRKINEDEYNRKREEIRQINRRFALSM